MANPLYDRLFGTHAASTSPLLLLADGGSITYATFTERVARFAHALTEIGLRPGDRAAVQVEKSPNALALYGACVQSGIVLLPLNTAYTATETGYFVTDSGAGALICPGARANELKQVADREGARLETLDASGTGTLADRARELPATFPTADRRADDLAALLYTSGTTGRSKGAMLTQGNLVSNATVLADAWRFTGRDVLLHALPIFHTHGLFVATNVTLAAGGAMIFLPKFDLDAVVEQMQRATAFMGVPTYYTRLLDDPRLDRALAGHMRLFVSGSAPLLEETHARFETRTGHRILERYGMTETGMNTSNPYDGTRRAGTVGPPLPGVELRVADADGAPVPDGEVGQIEVRGPNVFRGYWRMPEKTAAEMRPDGFFMTGDLGTVDRDGYVRIVGRAKDLVISGGYNVYPKEVEAVLDAQPGVAESAVIGVPHPDLGEGVFGLIVPEPGAQPDLAALTAAAGASLARYKQPRNLVVVEHLPRNAMGKVQKAALRETYRHAFAPA